jgi:hypothetical protein
MCARFGTFHKQVQVLCEHKVSQVIQQRIVESQRRKNELWSPTVNELLTATYPVILLVDKIL